jgi:predicted DNA-binding protein with PD1-like motif
MGMRCKIVDEKPKTFVLVFETNDELAQALEELASQQKLASASFKAIGALSSARSSRFRLAGGTCATSGKWSPNASWRALKLTEW